jgi:large subunit ribosomal protein L25
VDVTNLAVHEVVHVSDIPAIEGVEILTDADTVIATVGVIKEEPVEAPVVEGEAPAEPEVIGKGKKEEEGEGGEEK